MGIEIDSIFDEIEMRIELFKNVEKYQIDLCNVIMDYMWLYVIL